jgi:hypothetical protein
MCRIVFCFYICLKLTSGKVSRDWLSKTFARSCIRNNKLFGGVAASGCGAFERNNNFFLVFYFLKLCLSCLMFLCVVAICHGVFYFLTVCRF